MQGTALTRFRSLRGTPHALRGQDHALKGARVAQGPIRYYQGAPLVALFHPKGPQSPSCAQGALPRVQIDSVAYSGAVVNQTPFIGLRAPSATEAGFADSGALATWSPNLEIHSAATGSGSTD